MITNIDSSVINNPEFCRLLNCASTPRIIKNIIRKKSLIGLNLEAISFEKEDVDNTIPAKRAPISKEKPKV